MFMKCSAHYYCCQKIKSCNLSLVQFTQRSTPFVLIIWHMVPDKFKRVEDYKLYKWTHLKEFLLGSYIINIILFCLQLYYLLAAIFNLTLSIRDRQFKSSSVVWSHINQPEMLQ